MTASQQNSPEDSLALEHSSVGQGGSFSDFYGSPKSNNPFLATAASWIRLIPKSFRMPVFMMVGAIGALFLILMIVGTMRILNAPVGQIELQKIPGEELPVGLEIYLDNHIVGKTLPLTVKSVTVGAHQIKAHAGPDCKALDFEVEVLSGQSVFLPMSIKCGDLKVEPQKQPDTFKEWQVEIRILTTSKENIENATVYMGEIKKEAWPFQAKFPRKMESVNIRIEAPGFESKKLTASHNGVMRPPPIVVELKKLQKTVMTKPKPKPTAKSKPPPTVPSRASHSSSDHTKGFKKTTQTGSLEIATSPSAQVYVDGKNTGLTTPIYSSRALKLPIGAHVLEFRVKGKRASYKYRVNVKGDSPKNKLVIQKLGKDKVLVYGYISARRIR